MPLDRIALFLVVAVACVWCVVLLAGLVAALPWGLPILAAVAVVGYLLYRVIRERLSNVEDDYYEKNVKQ